MISVFFSYSHKDEDYRNILEVHLAPLKRQGIISTWHDRRVDAGDEILHEIDQYLEQADVILLLISPDFIGSDYCYEIEMSRAMERHEEKTARVIPVILRPCEWQEMPFGKLLATPNDGKPISKFPNQDEAFLEVVKAIRQVAEKQGVTASKNIPVLPSNQNVVTASAIRSSNLRIKQSFTDQERDRFLTDSFEFIANFFEASLKELEKRHPEIGTEYRRIDANSFTATAYVHGTTKSQFRIWIRDKIGSLNEISYSVDRSSGRNSSNGGLIIEDDGYHLFLQPSGIAMYNRQQNQQNHQNQLSQQGGAEFFWDSFIEPLQR